METVTGGAIEVDGIITELQAIHSTMQQNYIDLENKISRLTEFDLEHFLTGFVDKLWKYNDIICGILMMVLLWFVIKYVYRFFRLFF